MLLSVIIPAYGCADSIVTTVNFILRQTLPPDELIIIPNGSVKGNEKILNALRLSFELIPFPVPARRRRCGHHEIPYRAFVSCYIRTKIYIYLKKKGSKADSLNAGITYAAGDLIVTVDADTTLDKNCLEELVKPFSDPYVIAAGGRVLPVIRWNQTLSGYQFLEYAGTFTVMRSIFDLIKANVLLSGALSIFRRDIVYTYPFSLKTIGEDFEIVLRLNYLRGKYRKPYRILYVPSAVCRTAVPESFSRLFKQRMRWYIGLVETLKKYRFMILNPRYGTAGMLALPYLVIFEFLPPFILAAAIPIIFFCILSEKMSVWGLFMPLLFYLTFEFILSLISYGKTLHTSEPQLNNYNIASAAAGTVILLIAVKPLMNLAKLAALIRYPSIKGKWLTT